MDDKSKQPSFDFSFDPNLDDFGMGYDEQGMPGETSGPFLPNTEGRTEFLPPDVENYPVMEHEVKQDSDEYAQRPAEERLRQLFSQLHSQKEIVHGIIDAARTPHTAEDIERGIARARSRKFSVYSTANICSMLETAGGLVRVNEDGGPYEVGDVQPDIELIDGEEYYVAATPPAMYWQSTPEAIAVMEEDDPYERVERQLAKENELLPVHKAVLKMAAAEGGTTSPKLSAALDDHPLIAKPRRFFAQHFVDVLERAGAIRWSGRVWEITTVGQHALDELLADVEDLQDLPEVGNPHKTSAETQGQNW